MAEKTLDLPRVIIHLFDGNLLTIQQTKKILKNPELSDEEAEKIRDGFRMLAEVMFDKWLIERKSPTNTAFQRCEQ